ncbi:hypothetical protein F2Q69_00041149 [Brassica cretica]|uniref:Uncharacterized protein n=1 Tax=Brassica cretica TaxID=69181 RepID=A0A8S9N7I3_BRACR|nr:hypothetical protein F2Q69_00041149 [Brassica cretica]
MAMKPNGKSPVSFANDENVMFFKDVSPGPHETQLQLPSDPFMGGSKARRVKKYLPVMKQGSVYKLFNFYESKKKPSKDNLESLGYVIMHFLLGRPPCSCIEKHVYILCSDIFSLRSDWFAYIFAVKSYHGSESSCAIWLETKNTFIFNLAREGPQGNNTHVTTAKVARHGYSKPLSMFKHAICGLREIFIAGVCSTRS